MLFISVRFRGTVIQRLTDFVKRFDNHIERLRLTQFHNMTFEIQKQRKTNNFFKIFTLSNKSINLDSNKLYDKV